MNDFYQAELTRWMPAIWFVSCALWLLAFYSSLMFKPVLAVTIGAVAPICALRLTFGAGSGPAAFQLFFLLQRMAFAMLTHRVFKRERTRWTTRKTGLAVVVVVGFLGTTGFNRAISSFGG